MTGLLDRIHGPRKLTGSSEKKTTFGVFGLKFTSLKFQSVGSEQGSGNKDLQPQTGSVRYSDSCVVGLSIPRVSTKSLSHPEKAVAVQKKRLVEVVFGIPRIG